MVKYYESIEEDLGQWALEQSVFFTASAPTYGKHVNLSPKGLPSASFSILTPNLAAYIDATGSGNETISHIRENGRVTIMFCSFAASPRIMRFFCKGKVVEWDQKADFEGWLRRMGGKEVPGARAVIILEVFKVQTSCGFGVPLLTTISAPPTPSSTTPPTSTSTSTSTWEAHSPTTPTSPANIIPILSDRATLGHWADSMISKSKMRDYQAEWNSDSLDGLPGLRAARRDKRKGYGKLGGEVVVVVEDWVARAGLGDWNEVKRLIGAALMGGLVVVWVFWGMGRF